MKNKQSQAGKESIKFNTNKHRPENKDGLDSRSNEEQHFKGDDVTHNKKGHRKPEKQNK